MKLVATTLLLLGMSAFAVPQKSHMDVPAEMISAQRALQTARNELNNAGRDWGGHRVAAIKHIDEALEEVKAAEQFAREHHEMK
jgi:hypothetical protein